MTTEDRPEQATQEGGPPSAAAPDPQPAPAGAPAPTDPAESVPSPAPLPTSGTTDDLVAEPTAVAAAAAPPGVPAAVPSPSPLPSPAPLPSEASGDPGASPAPTPSEPAPVVPDGEPGAPSSAGGRARGLLIACIALFVLSVGLGILTAVLASKLDREVATRDDVEETAGRFATALLTYHFEDLERSKQAVLDLSTGKFRREYEQAFNGGLDVLITETKATSEGTVTDVFVSDIEDDTATAIVVADVRVTGTAGERRGASSYIQLELVRVAGRWRVDGVTNLNFGQNGTPTGVPTTPQSTTTAPPR